VKVLDFGISKIRAANTKITKASALIGTPDYMSPEQAMGMGDEVDHRTDQWALACIAWECLVGKAAAPVPAPAAAVPSPTPEKPSVAEPAKAAPVEAAADDKAAADAEAKRRAKKARRSLKAGASRAPKPETRGRLIQQL